MKSEVLTYPFPKQNLQYVALWQLLDHQMQAAFDELQWNSDPDNIWQDWNAEGRKQWWLWIEEDDSLSPIESLKVQLWYQLWHLRQQEAL